MKLRIASDIHTEFFGEDEISAYAEVILPPLPEDKETVLILPGDIGAASNPECLLNFLEAICHRFKQVLYIPGNHEYYRGDIQTTPQKIKGMVAHIQNLYFDEGDRVRFDARSVHMHTLWTDFDKGNPISMLAAEQRMNDYRLIRNGDRILAARDTYEIHRRTVAKLEEILSSGDIVITHHSPCLRSIPQEYLTDRVNGAYHSDLSDLIMRKKPKFWFHGHTHTACDYMEGNTRIISNPRGYGNQFKNNGYNPTLTVEI